MLQQVTSPKSTTRTTLPVRLVPQAPAASSVVQGQKLVSLPGKTATPASAASSARQTPYLSRLARARTCSAPPLVAVDIDEVIARYVDGFQGYLERTGHGIADPAALFREAHDPQSAHRAAFTHSGGLDLLDEVPGAVAGLARLRAAGVRLEAVTTRPAAMRATTERLLQRLLPADTFAAVYHVQPGEKGTVCSRLGAQVLIDDQGEYWWNRTGQLPAGVTRVQSWTAVVDRVLEILALNSCIRAPAPVSPSATPCAPLLIARHCGGASSKGLESSRWLGALVACA